jgi:hypothetical protein
LSKKDEGKYEPTLVYRSAIENIARVRAYGVKKHGHREDWRTTDMVKHYDAALRHIFADLSGESIDKESGELHLAHAMCNLMFLIESRYNKKRVEPGEISESS